MAINILSPVIGEAELNLVSEAVRTGWVCNGEYRSQFERLFADFIGTRYAVTTSSGTAALHLALAASGIGAGDEVIVPALTYVATANAVLYCGAKPVTIDIDPATWNIDPTKIKQKLTKKTKAILPVHLYGNPADLNALKEFGLPLIEDACEAHGATYEGARVGAIGDAGCFSFYGNKIITTGEGGMVTTNSEVLFNKVMALKNHSTDYPYYHSGLGFNYQMSNLSAGLGVAQMGHIQDIIQRKRDIGRLYHRTLTWVRHSPYVEGGVDWLFTVLTTKKKKLIKEFSKLGIETRPVFTPLNLLPHIGGDRCPVAEEIHKLGVSIPTSATMTNDEVVQVINTLGEII